MPIIDDRLLDACGEAHITENFNRILELIDGLQSKVDEHDSTLSEGQGG